MVTRRVVCMLGFLRHHQPTVLLPIMQISAILFDLDGTLVDTAPDLVQITNDMRHHRRLDALPFEMLRHKASAGIAGLLGAAFGIEPTHADFEAMRAEFLARYSGDICVQTTLFPGMESLLSAIEAQGLPWGIVTNKLAHLAQSLLEKLNLHTRTACLVGADTAAYPKPHPAPLLYAAEKLQIDPATAVYIGDDLRDIQAGRAAGMSTIAAAYGYCGSPTPPESWAADYIVYSVAELHTLLNRYFRSHATA